MKNRTLIFLIVFCIVFNIGCGLDTNKADDNYEEALQSKINMMKPAMIGAVSSKLLFADTDTVVILLYNGVVVYSFEEQKIEDILLLENNAIMGTVMLQGSEATDVFCDVNGTQIYFDTSFRDGDKNYCYDLETKSLSDIEATLIKEVERFDSYAEIGESQFLPGEEDSYSQGEEGIQIDKDDFVYLFNTTRTESLEGMMLVRCKGEEKIQIPIWD